MIGIRRAFELDVRRITSQGVFSIVALLIGFPAVIILLGSISGGVSYMPGAAIGGVSAMLALLPLNTFTFEQQGQNNWMNGVIPVRRIHQVIGRYLVVGACALILALEVAVCVGAGMLFESGTIQFSGLIISVLAAVVMYALLESVLLPLCYRFTYQKALLTMMLICIGLGAAIAAVFALLAKLTPAAIDALISWTVSLTETMSGAGMIWLALGGVVLAAAAAVVSLFVSLHIYLAKEF
ncbi:ABC-2 transporter permease [Bifidobacterium olomucense]|uniref:ABC-2 family transporter protein n=1 Tax=Bifidobacterium olomucense TaxID=2675324 RepID=A0A7Y0HXQ7_9BIFI|nr:ABC-2 transporter permease [Bifidobacterium sp. DSM 109959]NMM98284.1 ABC-2 family transporter protein [Bifidobacterium sp. DSM 109959]